MIQINTKTLDLIVDKLSELYWSRDVAEKWLATLLSEGDGGWLPIDENTPKYKHILLFYPKFKDQVVARWSHHFNCWITNFRQEINLGDPTMWQELPEDPK